MLVKISGRVLRRLMPFLTGLTIAGSAAAGSAVLSSPAVLSVGGIKRAGIVLETLRPARVAHSISTFGRVLDPTPVIRLSGEVAGAEAAVAGAEARVALDQKLAARSAQLYRGRMISASDYERMQGDLGSALIALTKARADRATLLDEAKIDWGSVLAAAIENGGDPLPKLASGTAMLIALSLPPGTVLAAPPQRVAAEAAGIRSSLRLIGPVPRMLGGYPGQSLLYTAPTQPGVPIGATVVASLPAAAERAGVVVPRSAVLWRAGRALVFRADQGDRFEPVPIATDIAEAGGYFVSTGLTAGDRIVVRGAALLLGAGEKKPQAGGGEDED